MEVSSVGAWVGGDALMLGFCLRLCLVLEEVDLSSSRRERCDEGVLDF